MYFRNHKSGKDVQLEGRSIKSNSAVLTKILDSENIVECKINKIEEEQTLSKELLLGFTERLLIVAAIVFVGRFLWRICIFGNGCKIEADIRNKMFRHMEKMSQTYFSNNKTGALMALYTNDLQTIRQSFGSGTLMFVDAVALGILASIKMIKLNPVLTIFCVIPLVIVGAFAMLMRRRISRKVRRNLEAFSSLSDYVQESYSGISVIKAYVKEKRKELLFDGYNKENKDTCIDFVKDHAFVQVTIGAILSTIMVTIIFVGGVLIYQAQTGNIVTTFTPGNLVTFNAYFGSLIWPVMAVGDLINLRGQSKASEKRISELLDEKVEINDLLVEYHDIDPSTIKGEIEYRNLSFNYPDSTVKVLENVNFHINPGEIVGIMGGTGSGKSTIVELLLRLYNIDDDISKIEQYWNAYLEFGNEAAEKEAEIFAKNLELFGISLDQALEPLDKAAEYNEFVKSMLEKDIFATNIYTLEYKKKRKVKSL